MLINGVWSANWQPVQSKDEDGRFIRQTSSFRNWITKDGKAGSTGTGGFKAEKGRYHLYIAYICPWASRVLMVRELKQLKKYISISALNPILTDQSWQFGGFPGADIDTVNGHKYLHELYTSTNSKFTGRATVPVLWDKVKNVIVNNESADIIRMLNNAFDHLTDSKLDLYPVEFAKEIDKFNKRIYEDLNNSVYQAGFASTQLAYEEAYHKVFNMLDELEWYLGDGRNYLFGDTISETDVRLFVTLIRFDAAYHDLFKCNRNTLASMPNLSRYVKGILSIKGIKGTVKLDHIKHGYYSIKSLNPSGIVPLGPRVDI